MPNLTSITDNFIVAAQEEWDDNLVGSITDSDTTLTVGDNSAYTVGDWVLWTIDAVDASSGEATPAKKEVVFGQISASNQLTSVVRGVEGTAQAHSNGAIVYDYTTAAHQGLIKKAFSQEHNTDGTHKDITADSVTTVSLTVSGSGGGLAPTGAVSSFAGSSAPTGWLLCDGSAVSRTTYADLYAVIGTTYGVGDGSTTFNVPNAKGKMVVGYDSTDTSFDALGETGGAKTNTLTTTQLPAHTHSVNPPATASTSSGTHSHTVGGNASWGSSGGWGISEDSTASSNGALTTNSTGAHTHTVDIGSFTSGSAGSGAAYSIMNPYITMNMIIKT